jgi:flagellar hook protein FlgE
MGVSFAAPISGIQVSQTRMDVTAHNVANVNTPGFAQSTVEQAEVRPEGVRIASITKTPNSNPALSNTDLAEAAKEEIVNKDTLAADVNVIKAKDRMLGTLLDMVA